MGFQWALSEATHPIDVQAKGYPLLERVISGPPLLRSWQIKLLALGLVRPWAIKRTTTRLESGQFNQQVLKNTHWISLTLFE